MRHHEHGALPWKILSELHKIERNPNKFRTRYIDPHTKFCVRGRGFFVPRQRRQHSRATGGPQIQARALPGPLSCAPVEMLLDKNQKIIAKNQMTFLILVGYGCLVFGDGHLAFVHS